MTHRQTQLRPSQGGKMRGPVDGHCRPDSRCRTLADLCNVAQPAAIVRAEGVLRPHAALLLGGDIVEVAQEQARDDEYSERHRLAYEAHKARQAARRGHPISSYVVGFDEYGRIL